VEADYLLPGRGKERHGEGSSGGAVGMAAAAEAVTGQARVPLPPARLLHIQAQMPLISYYRWRCLPLPNFFGTTKHGENIAY
jgi:hypothetical protein